MPHSSDPKLIVPFATEGDPLRQTVDRRKKKILGNYTTVEPFSVEWESQWPWIM